MNEPYPIIVLPPDARNRVEQMGTKEKFWFNHFDGNRWLFKYNRPGHGDDWSEKIGCEIAALLFGSYHAHVELATFGESRGVISRDFTERGRFPLTHGNELAGNIDPDYPKHQRSKVKKHTVEFVRHILDTTTIRSPREYVNVEGIESTSDLFAGYLMLDALIGNTDRHHENWAILKKGVGNVILAPTFDHASCLGFNLSDKERKDRMTPGGNRSIETFADKATSKLYLTETGKPLTLLAAFAETTKDRPAARWAWIDRLRKIGDNDLWTIIDRVPAERMSKFARDFAFALLKLNRDTILLMPTTQQQLQALYVAWQAPDGGRHYPVARLLAGIGDTHDLYEFAYIKGAQEAAMFGFQPFLAFPNLNKVCRSKELFPFFSNRLMSRKRPDFPDYLDSLGLESNADPMLILQRSEGTRATDSIQLFFPFPVRTETYPLFSTFFWMHGFRYLDARQQSRILTLQPGDALTAEPETDNRVDPSAIHLLTADQTKVGYLPQYLVSGLIDMLKSPEFRVFVERVNPPPAPSQQRLLCRLEACWPRDFETFSSDIYQPISPDATDLGHWSQWSQG